MEFTKYVYNLQAFTHKFIEDWEIIRGNALSLIDPHVLLLSLVLVGISLVYSRQCFLFERKICATFVPFYL